MNHKRALAELDEDGVFERTDDASEIFFEQ